MKHPAGLPSLVASLLALTGCATVPAAERTSARVGNGVVVDSEELLVSRGSLVRAIASRVANSEVVNHDGCRALRLRGRKSLLSPELPAVYVEGQRAVNGCILEMLNPEDVSHVEVYASGITERAGYYGQPGGLILVFLKGGQEER